MWRRDLVGIAGRIYVTGIARFRRSEWHRQRRDATRHSRKLDFPATRCNRRVETKRATCWQPPAPIASSSPRTPFVRRTATGRRRGAYGRMDVLAEPVRNLLHGGRIRAIREVPMTAILTDLPQMALWTDLVREAEAGAATRLDEDLESYLVLLLIAHTRDVRLHSQVIAIDFLLARAQSGALRRQELRDVGDRCLLLAGLYPEQAEQRLVGIDYFLGLGSRAYHELSAALSAGFAELYRYLAEAFARLARVLMELRRHTRDIAPLLLHELRTSGPESASDPQFPGAVLLTGGATRQ
jgi:hypothetical protein